MLVSLTEVYRNWELLRTLTIKELKVKYRNSVLGFLWSFAHPLMLLAIFTFAFKVALKVPIENYAVFLLSGLLPWSFFSSSLQRASMAIWENAPLVRKVYFPRAVLPFSLILANLFNFCATLVILLLAAAISGNSFAPGLLLLPVIVVAQLLLVLGIGCIVATLNAFYRDTSYLLDVGLVAWFYLTPVVYPLEMIPSELRHLMMLNPMTLVVELYRTIIYDAQVPSLGALLAVVLMGVALLSAGLSFLRRHEYRFPEEV